MSKPKWLDRTLITGPRLILCLNDAQWKAAMKQLNVAVPEIVEKMGAATQDFELPSGGLACVVFCDEYLQKDHTSIQIACILVHEAVHVWQKYLAYIGEDCPSKEFEAYSIEAIAKKLMEAYCLQSAHP